MHRVKLDKRIKLVLAKKSGQTLKLGLTPTLDGLGSCHLARKRECERENLSFWPFFIATCLGVC